MALPQWMVRTIVGTAFDFPTEDPTVISNEGGSPSFNIPLRPHSTHTLLGLRPELKEGTYKWPPPDETEGHAQSAFIFRFAFSIRCAEIKPLLIELRGEHHQGFLIYPPFVVQGSGVRGHPLWKDVPNSGPNPFSGAEPLPRFEHPGGGAGTRECSGLRVDILAGPPDQATRPANDLVIGEPRILVNHLMRLIRYRTRQWWVARGDGPRVGSIIAAYPINRDGAMRGFPFTIAEVPTVFEPVVPLDTDIWLQLARDIATDFAPPAYDARLLDAYYALALPDTDAAVLALANAAEIARTVHLERAVRRGRSDVRWSLNAHLEALRDRKDRWAITRHLGDIAKALVGRSLADDDAAAFESIRLLWECRGNVAHGKPPTIKSRSGQPELVGPDTVVAWVHGVRRAVAWLENL